MINQDLVRSGYHFEVLFSLQYLSNIFHAAIDSGDLTLSFSIPATPTVSVNVDLRPPNNINRDYPLNPGAVLPAPSAGSFMVLQANVTNPQVADSLSDELALTININADLQDTRGGVISFNNTPLSLLVNMRLDFDNVLMEDQPLNTGMQVVNPRFVLDVADINGPAITALGAPPFSISKNDILTQISNIMPPFIPFVVTGNESPIQKMDMRLHPGDASRPTAIGIYLNLFIRIPDTIYRRPSFSVPNTILADATNFLPMGSDIGVAMSGRIFELNSLGRHIEELIQEQKDNGEFDKRMKINYVKVFPRSGKLRLSINMRYDLKGLISSLDPKGTLHIDFSPEIDDDGLLSWKTSVDVTTKSTLR